MKRFLAIDLGAESGRAILGSLSEARLTLEELHRFLNEPVRLPDGLYWDTFRLFHNICEGLRIAGRERKIQLDGIGVDTWGVDYGLIDAHGELVVNPRHYRDPRNSGMLERTFQVVDDGKEVAGERLACVARPVDPVALVPLQHVLQLRLGAQQPVVVLSSLRPGAVEFGREVALLLGLTLGEVIQVAIAVEQVRVGLDVVSIANPHWFGD